MAKLHNVPPEELERQRQYALRVRELLAAKYPTRAPRAFVHTYGCQGNVADGERIEGQLEEMGYEFCDSPENADFALYNTCAVREHAEDRVFGNVGKLKNYKQKNPDMVLALCGCMMQQAHVRDRIYKSYPYVNLVFGTHVLHRLPELLYETLTGPRRVVCAPDSPGEIAEHLPVRRTGGVKAWLPIMYGCDNFCSYCVVPYVRSRERSREPEDVLCEARGLIASGCREITLLGQNVNSYGKGNVSGLNFAGLLRELNALPGDFKLRFMTSHPKDCTHELLETIAACDKVSKHLHLPVQSGNDRVLAAMNRRYTRAQYLDLVADAKATVPGLSLTSDIIVGFPGETYAEFCDTLSLVEAVGYTSLFTFIYSPRVGTAAAKLPDPVSHKEKTEWFAQLTALQEKIAAGARAQMRGRTYTVLVEGRAKAGGALLAGRTDGNIMLEFPGDPALIGTYQNVRVTDAGHWTLLGERTTDAPER